MRANLVGRSVVSAITQTPASGPAALTTVPPISVAPTVTVCCAKTAVGIAPGSAIKPAHIVNRASALVTNIARLPTWNRLFGWPIFRCHHFSKKVGSVPVTSISLLLPRRKSVAFGYHAMLGTRRATSRLCICGMVGIILKFEPRVVSAKTRWSLQRQRFVSEAAIPRHIAIGRHDQIISMEFCPQCVGLTRPYRRQIDAPLRLDVHVSTRAALFMGVHAGVALDRDRDRGVWLDVPHGIDQIAGVLGLQLQSDLTSQFARCQGFAGLSRAKIAEVNFCGLVRGGLRVRANDRPGAWCIDRKPAARQHRNVAIGHAKIVTINSLQRRSGLVLRKSASGANDECQNCQCAPAHWSAFSGKMHHDAGKAVASGDWTIFPVSEEHVQREARRRWTASGTRAEFGLAVVRVICPSGGLLTGVSSPLCKNISVSVPPKSHLELFASRPTQRGVSRSSRTRDGMRWTRQRFAREGIAGRVERLVSDHRVCGREMLPRTAKSCGPDAPTLVSSSRSCVGPTGLRQNLSADDGGKRARSPGRARRKPLKPLRAGMPGDSGVLVVARVRSTNTIAHEAAGATGARHSPRPPWGGRFMQTSGASRREVAKSYLELQCRHCEERSDEAIHPSFLLLMDCFASLAMT